MTNAEIDVLSAGRDIDFLIAEKVIGWRWDPTGHAWIEPPGGARSLFGKPTFYSTEMASTWEIIELFDGFRLDRTQLEDKPYIADLIRFSPEASARGWGDTMSLAICRAALKIVTK